MRRELHVRFWEGPGVRFPRATRLVLLFSRLDDARRVLDVLPKRFGKYGLTLHADKTRLVPFRRPALQPRPGGSKVPKPGTFHLLGFTHCWVRSRQGNWVVKQRTACDRFTRALARVAQWCRENRHQPVRWQWQILTQKLRGHFGYYGITGHFEAIDVGGIPRSIIERLPGTADEQTRTMLHLLAPLTTGSVLDGARFLRDIA